MSRAPDPQAYRVTLICACQGDYAVGYGATAEEARATAYKFFRKDHGRRAKPAEETLDRVSADGTHYELVEEGGRT